MKVQMSARLVVLSMLAMVAGGGCNEDAARENAGSVIVVQTDADRAPFDGDLLDQSLGHDAGLSADSASSDALSEDDPTAPLLDPEFVMDEVILLPADSGFDLDDDGTPDNALALLFSDPLVGQALGGDPNEFIARTVRRGELLLLLDFHQLSDYSNDRRHHIDIFLGRDEDDRRRNNFEGDGRFFIGCSSLTNAGEPESQFNDVRLEGGRLQGAGGQFRFLVSFSNTEVLLRNGRIEASMAPDGMRLTDGQIGGAVSYADLEEVVLNDPEIGPDFARIMLAFISRELDVDLSGDGTRDALSASFRFSAVRAEILRDLPCRD
ncbi:MAG: hypothetical protein ACON3Z_15130 [Bradymonadia bacterium]